MKRYQVNQVELRYIVDILDYLNTEGNTLTEQGQLQLKDVLDRVHSRPVIDMIIDAKVLEEAQTNKEDNND